MRSVGRCIISGLGIGVGSEVESGYNGEVGGWVGSRDGRSFDKYSKGGFNVIIYDSVD